MVGQPAGGGGGGGSLWGSLVVRHKSYKGNELSLCSVVQCVYYHYPYAALRVELNVFSPASHLLFVVD